MTISSAVDASAVARVVGIKTAFKDFRAGNIVLLPQRIAVIGQGATSSVYSTDKVQYTSASDVGAVYGFGSPLHLAAKQLFPDNGDGVGSIPVTFYPLIDGTTAAVGDITPVGAATKAGTFIVKINNIASSVFSISIADGVSDVVAALTTAINAAINVPVTAVDNLSASCDLTSKWKGASANDIFVSVDGPTDTGITFSITQPVGGAANPDVQAALDKVGNVWETMFLNCMEIDDTTTLDTLSAFGESRWGALVKKPMISFVGNNEADVNTSIVIPTSRASDRTNCQLVSPGSVDLPFVTAARELARIAVVANNNPPQDYGSQRATGLVPGDDGDQWNYSERDQAVKAGSSTIEKRDNVVTLADTVTFYHPTGEVIPAYRYVVDIVKLQNIIFNLDIIFATTEWDGAPLIPDNQPTANPSAKKPKMAKAAAAAMADSLGSNTIISDPEFTKANIVAGINESNPKRLDLVVPVKLAGNANIISIDLNFGFFFGTNPIVA